jgi:MFS family permease
MNPIRRLTLIVFLLFMARGVTGPLSSLYWRSLGASYLVIGLLGTVTAVVAIVASPLWGRASDRLGKRKLFLVGGLGVLSLCYGLIARANSAAVLFPIQALAVAAQAAYDTASLALIGDWMEHAQKRSGRSDGVGSAGRRIGTYRGLASLGFGAMAFVSGMVADRFSLRTPFLLAGGILAVAFLLSLGVSEAPSIDADDEDATRSDDAAAVSIPDAPVRRLPLTPLLVAALLWALVVGAVYAVWGNYMVEELNYTPAQMTRLWSLASLSEFPLMILAGWLSDKVGRLPMLAAGFVAWAMVFAGYLVAPTMPWIAVVQLIRGFAYSAHTATSMTYAAEVRARAERGRTTGIYGMAGGLGSIMGSSLGGAVTEFAGFRALIGAGSAVMAAGAFYLGAAGVQVRRRDTAAALTLSEPTVNP